MNDFEMKGKSSMSGGTFGAVRVDGILSVKGDLTCSTLEMNGSCRMNGSLRISGKADIDGVCRISGDMDAEDIDLDGRLTVAGDMTSENARLNGSLSVGGTLNIGSLDLKLHGSSKIKEAVGGRIVIRHSKGAGYFRADLVEGDEIDIERSKIKVVRGDKVVIGKDCTADRIEYRSSLDVHPKAAVKEKIKLD
ncbi:MAG: hypothetical protein LBB30_03765 [Candidatus Methanoplasma sp.]|jgi:cytoskeletal protein CcmA (bactofilin family)|nr:hypothetical protein [Candidatus Methanoplasma sp.]